MSNTTKAVLGLGVIAVAGLGYYLHTSSTTSQESAAASVETANLPTGSSTDDASLNQDFTAIDSQMQAAHTDVTAADASADAASH